jgi:hypothetical protein
VSVSIASGGDIVVSLSTNRNNMILTIKATTAHLRKKTSIEEADLGSLGSLSLAKHDVPFSSTSFAHALAAALHGAFALATALHAALAFAAFALQHSFIARWYVLLQERTIDRLNLLDNSQNIEPTMHQRDAGIRGSMARGGELVRSRV